MQQQGGQRRPLGLHRLGILVVCLVVALVPSARAFFLPSASLRLLTQTQKHRSATRARTIKMVAASSITTSGKLQDDYNEQLAAVKSVLYLATDAGADKGVEPEGFATLQQHAGAAGAQALKHVPIDVKNLSFQLADELMDALDALPDGPALVVCSSGGRASAVKCLRQAIEGKWTRDATLAYAEREGLPFLKNAHLKDWVLGTVARKQFPEPLLFRPLYEETSWTYSFLLACPKTKEAIIIDPVDLTVDRDVQVVTEMGVTLKYAANTHCHADHVTGSGLLMRKLPGCQSAIADAAGADAAVKLKDGDRIHFGERYVECRATPGHTDGCMSFVSDDMRMVFTGDALLIRGCGRTDFQQGSPERLYESIHTKIFSLPAEVLVYPGHDYRGRLFTTVGEEKRFNARLAGKTREEFISIMNNLKLDYPKKIDVSLPSNKVDGLLNR